MKQKKHILIAYQYLSFKGGIEEVIMNQSRELKKAGYSVSLLTSQFSNNDPNTTPDNIPISRVKSLNMTYKWFGIPFALPMPTVKTYKTLIDSVKKADVVNVHGHPYMFSFICILLCQIYKKPVILTQHNTKIISKSKIMNILSSLLDYIFGRYNLVHSTKIISVSEETNKYVNSIAKVAKKSIVVYNGVDIARFTPAKNRAALRKQYNLPVDAFICFTVRRLTFKNGIETFLQIAQLHTHKNTLFLLGGTGPDKQNIEKYITTHKISNVKLLGFIKDEDLPAYYAASDVFILPSIQGEGFPMVILESFASGIPVIATRSGGHIEVIKAGTHGYITPVNDPQSMQEKVAHIQLNPSLRKSMAKQCRDLAVKSFSWKENVHGLIQIVSNVS